MNIYISIYEMTKNFVMKLLQIIFVRMINFEIGDIKFEFEKQSVDQADLKKNRAASKKRNNQTGSGDSKAPPLRRGSLSSKNAPQEDSNAKSKKPGFLTPQMKVDQKKPMDRRRSTISSSLGSSIINFNKGRFTDVAGSKNIKFCNKTGQG